jgi:hypothetical protein
MAVPEMSLGFALTDEVINKVVVKTSPGVYLLDATSNGPFDVAYAGRSDSDLNSRLHDWVGKYKYFSAAYCPTAKAAFEAECELYHQFGPRHNQVHPARPVGSNAVCPCCYIYG